MFASLEDNTNNDIVVCLLLVADMSFIVNCCFLLVDWNVVYCYIMFVSC